LRLTPRAECLGFVSQNVQVQPQPSVRRSLWDAYGNRIEQVEFMGSTQTLWIESRAELDTVVPAPFETNKWSMPWTAQAGDGLGPYRETPYDPEVQRFANDLSLSVHGDPLAFLDLLAQTLRERSQIELRVSGDAQPAGLTLAQGRGSCRDLTVLFLSACRSLGMAARFTSGYALPFDNLDLLRDMHAWAEVFVPGYGFRGWDPTQGKRVLDAHVPLCAAPTQGPTMPVEGTYAFSGSVVNTTLDFELRIQRI
jgi:transglutaminase-like putative cysteine protease